MKKEELEEIRNNMLIEVYSWGGLGITPGSSSTIITNDKKIYFYSREFILKNNENKEELSGGKELSDKSFNLIKTYIEENYINKNFEIINVRDSGCTVRGPGFCIVNHFDEYRKIKELINTIINNDKLNNNM